MSCPKVTLLPWNLLWQTWGLHRKQFKHISPLYEQLLFYFGPDQNRLFHISPFFFFLSMSWTFDPNKSTAFGQSNFLLFIFHHFLCSNLFFSIFSHHNPLLRLQQVTEAFLSYTQFLTKTAFMWIFISPHKLQSSWLFQVNWADCRQTCSPGQK